MKPRAVGAVFGHSGRPTPTPDGEHHARRAHHLRRDAGTLRGQRHVEHHHAREWRNGCGGGVIPGQQNVVKQAPGVY
eukprot:scaffold15995_cov120-Isochrysis_galbana.AAC.3